mmetsp:Transcript_45188/g.101684  ORF Transcript_45188/g.101684 Transcript_45188/m.101684 type:complete len:237 (-) Transcript_45188:292-1002(-)
MHVGPTQAVAVPIVTEAQEVGVHGQKPWRLRHTANPEICGRVAVVDHPLLYLSRQVALLPARHVDDDDPTVGDALLWVVLIVAQILEDFKIYVVVPVLQAVLHSGARVTLEVHVPELLHVSQDKDVGVEVDHPWEVQPLLPGRAPADEVGQVERGEVEGAGEDLTRVRGVSEADERLDVGLEPLVVVYLYVNLRKVGLKKLPEERSVLRCGDVVEDYPLGLRGRHPCGPDGGCSRP